MVYQSNSEYGLPIVLWIWFINWLVHMV